MNFLPYITLISFTAGSGDTVPSEDTSNLTVCSCPFRFMTTDVLPEIEPISNTLVAPFTRLVTTPAESMAPHVAFLMSYLPSLVKSHLINILESLSTKKEPLVICTHPLLGTVDKSGGVSVYTW